MRTLPRWVAIAALLCGITGAAQAGTFVPDDSFIEIRLSFLRAQALDVGWLPVPAREVYALPGTEGGVSLAGNGMGGHDVIVASTVWSSVNVRFGTSLYTGVPVFDFLQLTMKNQAATFQSSYSYTNFVGDNTLKGPVLGGVSPLQGRVVVWMFGFPAWPFNLGLLGAMPGVVEHRTVSGISLSTTSIGGPWVSGALTMTDITTNIISVNGVTGVSATLRPFSTQAIRTLSTNGGFVSTGHGLPLEAHTITLLGSNDLQSASQAGAVTLVAPVRIHTPSGGGHPLVAHMTLRFVPEPATPLLLVAGAVGMAVVGWTRRPK